MNTLILPVEMLKRYLRQQEQYKLNNITEEEHTIQTLDGARAALSKWVENDV